MYTITKQFEFCYAHRLHGYPGQCGNIHGHTAKVEVICKKQDLPESGMAIDFKELSKIVGSWINENLDHKIILSMEDPVTKLLKENGEDVLALETQPSAENLARLIYFHAKKAGLPVAQVSVFESPTSIATYEEE